MNLRVRCSTHAAIRLGNQLQFYAGAYLNGLFDAIRNRGVSVYEGTRVIAVEDGEPCIVHTEGGATVRARAVFVAAHVPTVNTVFLQTKVAAYRSYVIAYPGVQLSDGLFGTLPIRTTISQRSESTTTIFSWWVARITRRAQRVTPILDSNRYGVTVAIDFVLGHPRCLRSSGPDRWKSPSMECPTLGEIPSRKMCTLQPDTQATARHSARWPR